MNEKKWLFGFLICFSLFPGCNPQPTPPSPEKKGEEVSKGKESVGKKDPPPSKEELKKKLTPEQYYVCIEKGTESPFSGKYTHCKDPGIYRCVVCKQELFSSKTKYDSHSGWPSFWDPISSEKVTLKPDSSHGMERIEVLCGHCGAHLGHVFDDGPKPTGKRYCINSVSLDLEKK